MHGEHPHSQQVGLTQVVDEAAYVAEESGVDAVYIPHLQEMIARVVTMIQCSLWFLVASITSNFALIQLIIKFSVQQSNEHKQPEHQTGSS